MAARGSDINTLSRMRAVLGSQSLVRLGARLDHEAPVGGPARHPMYVLLAFGTLARLARSGVRVEYDLADPAVWGFARNLLTDTVQATGLDLRPPPSAPPRWDHWRWARDRHLASDEGLAALAREYPAVAADLARSIGLCRPESRGSFSHPAPERCIYGDGTQVRPLYAPPPTETITLDDGTRQIVYPDPKTGELRTEPARRFDPDLQPHHGQLGPVLTHGYVAWHARGASPYQRVVLAAAHVPAPGQEAATAVRLAGDVHRHLGNGVQAAIYDGAMHGTHIEEMMRRYGWLVVAKTPDATRADDGQRPELFVNASGHRARSYPLGTITHDTDGVPCHHQLAAVNGQVVELGLDETGDPVVLATLERGAVKRSRRATGRYYFNVGYQVPCQTERFTTWLSPHPNDENDPTRPHNLRIIPEEDPDFSRLHGLRNDSENFHSNLKRTLIVGRAMSLGWRRGLLDVYCYSLLSNALTEHRAAETERARDTPTLAARGISTADTA